VYQPTKNLVLDVFRAPRGEPEAPAGSHASVRVMRASPKYLTYRMLPLWIGALVVAGVFLITSIGALWSQHVAAFLAPVLVVVIAVPVLALAWFCTRVDYDLRYYVLTDRSVRVREGAWLIDEKTITYANVQNVRVEQGPLQRLFGISDVRVDTAGGGAASAHSKHGGGTNHGVVLAGIENANEVRDAILEHLRLRAHGAGLGDLDDERARVRNGAFDARHVALMRDVERAAAQLRAVAERRVG
jgi:membrane protein YdbS with pleckstrin-like domain